MRLYILLYLHGINCVVSQNTCLFHLQDAVFTILCFECLFFIFRNIIRKNQIKDSKNLRSHIKKIQNTYLIFNNIKYFMFVIFITMKM